MNKYPLVSVLIPTYNRKELLKRAINSVLNQTYKNIEIYVTDNASTDGTFEVMQELLKNDKRIIMMEGYNARNIHANDFDDEIDFVCMDVSFISSRTILDVLFKNSIGRYDFPTSSVEDTKSTLKKIYQMNIDYHIYPGHGEDTTLYTEKCYNPFFKA